MFGWRRKGEGFDWRQHVRTTIKVRRDMRRERVALAKDSVANHAQGAARATGSGLVWLLRAIGAGLVALLAALLRLIEPATGWVGRHLHAALSQLTRPTVAVPLGIAGAAALVSATVDIATNGFTHSAILPLTVGSVLVLFVLPTLEGLFASGERDVKTLPFIIAFGLIGGAAAGAHTWMQPAPHEARNVASTGSVADRKSTTASTSDVSVQGAVSVVARLESTQGLVGRAQAVRGDHLRINGQIVALAGIESPDPAQRCQRADGRAWRCGEAAQAELERLLEGKPVACRLAAVRGAREAQPPLAVCGLGDRDVASELVRGGHVFLSALAPANLTTLEADARRGKLGLWQGQAERPDVHRAKVWDQAKTKAPNGCAIKGQVTGLGRHYLMPWSSDYSKARIRKERGDRWFCTESEAKAAGWVPAPPG